MNVNCTRGVKALGAMAIAGLLTACTLAADKEAGKPSSPQSPAAGTQKNLNSPTPSPGGQPASAAPAGQINQAASDNAAKAPPVATPPRPQSNPAPAATSDKPQANDARPVDGQPRGEKQTDPARDQGAQPDRDRDRRDADRNDPSRASAPKSDNADAKRSENNLRRQPSGAVQHQTNRAYSNTPNGARPGALNNNSQSRAAGYNTANIGLALGAGNRGLFISSIGSNGYFANAGFQPGDQIISAGAQSFANQTAFYTWLGLAQAGQRLPIMVMRNGQQQTVYWTPSQQFVTQYAQRQ